MKNNISNLLEFLCVKWGFCLPPDEHDRIEYAAEWRAEEFAVAVLLAEGLNPEYEIQWKRMIRDKFREHFGAKQYSNTN